MSLVLLPLCMPDNLWLDIRHCEFYFSAVYVCIFINILELSSGMQSLLGKSLILQVMLLWFMGWVWSSAQSNYSPQLRQYLLGILPNDHEWWIFPLSLMGKAMVPGPECFPLLWGTLPSNSFGRLFPQALSSFLTVMCCLVLCCII